MSQRIIGAHRLQKKKKGETVSERQHKTSYEENIFTYAQNPMIKVLGLHVTKVFTFKRRKLQATKKLSLRHLSIVLSSRRGRGNFLARSRRWHWIFRRWRWCGRYRRGCRRGNSCQQCRCQLLRLLEESLHLIMGVAMGGANPLPVEVRTVGKRKRNSTLGTTLN
jgi:hypothetical protein